MGKGVSLLHGAPMNHEASDPRAARLRRPRPAMQAAIALCLMGCAKRDLGSACHELEAQGLAQTCEKASAADVAKQAHVAEQWNFREAGNGKGFGSLTLYNSAAAFESEARDMAQVSRELRGFHYENASRLVQLETRYPTDSRTQTKMVGVLDSL